LLEKLILISRSRERGREGEGAKFLGYMTGSIGSFLT
jgi:hypothetical protein